MKTVEKEFVNHLNNILQNQQISIQNKYFVNRVVDIFNSLNMRSINLINLKDYSILLDHFNYEGYNRGLLIIKVLINNFKIIDSKPYSMIDFMKYKNIYEKRDISFEQFILDVKYLINSDDVELNSYHYDIFKMLQNEEKSRLIKVKKAREIKLAYDNLDINSIINYFESIGLNKKDIEGVRIYLNSLKVKCKEPSSIAMDLKVNPIKLGYTKKEIKEMENELNNILKEIDEKNIKITYQEYLHFLKYVFILEDEHKACDADINRLYDALIIDKSIYPFLILKAKSLLQTNKAIDIQNALQDINDVESIIKVCDQKDREDFEILLKDMYENLYCLDSYNHNYERTLKF